jgi:hypothetical protein
MKRNIFLTLLFVGLVFVAASQDNLTQDEYNKNRGTYLLNINNNMSQNDSAIIRCSIRIMSSGGCSKRLTKGKIAINGTDFFLDESGVVNVNYLPGKFSFKVDTGLDWVFSYDLKKLKLNEPLEYNITFFLVQKEIMKE